MNHEDLKSAIDSLPDGPDKDRALSDLALLRQLEREGRENAARASRPGADMISRIGCFIFFCAIAGYLFVSLYQDRFPHIIPALFLGVFALIFLGIALGFENTRIEIKFPRRNAFSRRIKARQRELAKKNKHGN